MLGSSQAYSGFSTNDIARAKQFYGETLGLEVTEQPMG
jgi:catechol 2,3-dioxygenase-like lactoylglutathione lyase family enzyme